jgi:hypothetical protein
MDALLELMENVAKLAWADPAAPGDGATFEELCAYRQRMYYRPYQISWPNFAEAMDGRDMAGESAKERALADTELSKLIQSPESFDTLWSAWQQSLAPYTEISKEVTQWAKDKKLQGK